VTNFGPKLAFIVSLLLSVVLILGSGAAWSDPISAQEAAEFEALVRQIMKLRPTDDILVEAKGREAKARAELQIDPNSREALRDLGDALHMEGHMAEHAHDFDLAVRLHLESLAMFQRSGLPSRESWDDGVVHAQEHILMDKYDKGVALLPKDPTAAEALFDEAYDWSEQTKLASSTAQASERFLPRYYALVKRRGLELKALSKVAVQFVGKYCALILTHARLGRT
jgi:hypothetical protein